MKSSLLSFVAFCATAVFSAAAVSVDDELLGNSLGGWKKRGGKAAEYPLSGAAYRTYRPEVSPTPDGGLFVSLRIDHVRGWLSSDDHAILEITVDAKGNIVSAQSNIAIQGRSITSDVILGSNEAARQTVGMDRAVQIGTELVANLSAKLLREKIVEAGRVSFPAAVRHNYNLLFQAIRVVEIPAAAIVVSPDEEQPANPPPDEAARLVEPEPAPGSSNAPLTIKPYGTATPVPVHPKK